MYRKQYAEKGSRYFSYKSCPILERVQIQVIVSSPGRRAIVLPPASALMAASVLAKC